MSISLRPYTYFMRSNVNLWSFGVTGVKRSFSAKMLLLLQNTWCYLYVTQCIYVAHKIEINLRLSIAFIGSRSTWDHFLRQGTPSVMANVSSYPAGVSGRVLYLTRFFLLLLATLPRLIASTCPDRFPPNLVTRTPDSWHLCHLTRMGSKVT